MSRAGTRFTLSQAVATLGTPVGCEPREVAAETGIRGVEGEVCLESKAIRGDVGREEARGVGVAVKGIGEDLDMDCLYSWCEFRSGHRCGEEYFFASGAKTMFISWKSSHPKALSSQ